jgi:hypothetical protein
VFTTDVTRVMTIISLPLVLAGADKIFNDQRAISYARILAAGVVIALLPPLNWSGLDYFLWPAFNRDICKWHLYCGFMPR